jgi:hypothetical protein
MRRRSLEDLKVVGITFALSVSCSQVLGLGDFEDEKPQGEAGEAGTGPDDGGANGNGGNGMGGSSGSGTSGSGVGGDLGGTDAGGAGSGGRGGQGGNAGTTSGSGGEGGLPDPGDGCRWNCDGAECVIEAEDADSDGYGSSDCTSAPGTDCDDTDEAISPDAIRFTSDIEAIPNRRSMAVTWNPMGAEFGLLGNSGMNGIYFTSITPGGVIASAPDSIIATNSTSSYFAARLTWMDSVSEYGTLHTVGSQGGPSATFVYLNEQGEFLDAIGFPDCQNADVDIRANGDALLTVAGFDLLAIGDVAGRAPYVPRDGLPESAALPRIATNGDVAAVAWTVRDTTNVKWARVSASLSFSNPVDLSSAGLYPDVVTAGDNYAIGWLEAPHLMFQISRSDGTTVCAEPIRFGDGTLDPADGIALAATANGTLVLAVDHAGTVAVFRMNDACAVVGQIAVHAPASSPTLPNLAVGNGTVLLVWDELVNNVGSAQFRFASELGCP